MWWQNRLKQIIKILEASNINEIEVSFWGRKFRVSKGNSESLGANQKPQLVTITNPSGVQVDTFETQEISGKIVETSTGVEVRAPMVGTFYRAPSPESPPYVNVGDHVIPGQTLCIIEAMKIMNEIEAEVSGSISKILVENSKPVEYGQPLFIIEPD